MNKNLRRPDCGCDSDSAANLLQRLWWPPVEQGGALTALGGGGECESALVKGGSHSFKVYTIPAKEQLDKPQPPSPLSHQVSYIQYDLHVTNNIWIRVSALKGFHSGRFWVNKAKIPSFFCLLSYSELVSECTPTRALSGCVSTRIDLSSTMSLMFTSCLLLMFHKTFSTVWW